MNTNAWARLTETRAQAWNAWGTWRNSDQESPEPPLDDFGKEMITNHIIDGNYAFNAYKPATIDSTQWRMGSLFGVTVEQLQQGYTAYPDEWSVVGMWGWEPGDKLSRLRNEITFSHSEALLFMPDVCTDPPDCTSFAPATEVTDVNLLAGQPPRDFTVTSKITRTTR